jgi:hypothetical protein
MSGTCKKPFYLSGSFLLTYEQINSDVNYHHYYSPVLSGGLRAAEGRMCDAVSLRPDAPGSRGHPPDPPSGLRCT